MRRNDVGISTDQVMTLLDQVEDKLKGLNGLTEKNVSTNDKDKASRKAEISRRLLFAAHLAKTAELEIMNQYHIFKGEDPPKITPTGGNG
jgi:hypothetical protein